MKKYGKSITRTDLHTRLQQGFGQAEILSEYGMTECLSQLYSTDHLGFAQHDMMSWTLTDPTDPRQVVDKGGRGRINLIDLANLDTISFIATDDLGTELEDSKLQVMGRIDNSDLRGCNYLIT